MELLTSTQSLVLQSVTWRVRVERKRGGQLVTLTAASVSEFIADKFKASVAPKAAHNALRALVDAGRLTRREFSRSGFKTVFAYGLPTTSAEVPVVFLEKPAMTSADDATTSASTQTPSAMPSASASISSKNQNELTKADAAERAVSFS